MQTCNRLRNQANLRAQLAERKVERLKINAESAREKFEVLKEAKEKEVNEMLEELREFANAHII